MIDPRLRLVDPLEIGSGAPVQGSRPPGLLAQLGPQEVVEEVMVAVGPVAQRDHKEAAIVQAVQRARAVLPVQQVIAGSAAFKQLR